MPSRVPLIARTVGIEKRGSLPVSPRWRTRGFSDYRYLRNTFFPIEVQMPFLSFVRKVGSI